MRSVVVTGLVFCGHGEGGDTECDYPATCAVAAGTDYPVDPRCDAHAFDPLESDVDTVLAVVLAEDFAAVGAS